MKAREGEIVKKALIIFAAIVIGVGTIFGLRGVQMTDKDNRIDYIEIPVLDVSEAKRFYGDLFGWKFVDYGPDYASFNDGRMDGGFTKTSTVERGGVLVILYSVDLELVRDRVKSAGGAIVRDIFEFPGGRRFHFTDPSGNELAVWSEQ